MLGAFALGWEDIWLWVSIWLDGLNVLMDLRLSD
jgi:hypothetical protein